MKKLFLLLITCYFTIALAKSQSEFITTWQITTANDSITIPTKPGLTYNYNIDWGDGNTNTGETANASHTYASSGNYTIKITGTFPAIYFRNSMDNHKIIEINQWGNQVWQTMENAFERCSHLTGLATDSPNLSNVTNMSRMFLRATSFNQPLNNWDVSNVTNMHWMFRSASSFNQPLNNWDVSNVTDMSFIFAFCDSFNQPINNWNVSNVNDMYAMFYDADNFNQSLSNWNVSNVTNMHAMFKMAINFNQPLNNWNVSSVTDMSEMFTLANRFNQPLNNWNVSNVTNMYTMFGGATNFNQALNNWEIINVTDMRYMFEGITLSTANYDTTLIGWVLLTLQPNINFSGGNSQYCKGKNAHLVITNAPNNWIITDMGETLSCD